MPRPIRLLPTRVSHTFVPVLVLFLAITMELGLVEHNLIPAARPIPDATALSQDCYAKIGPLLRTAGGRLTPEVRNAYLDWAEQTVMLQLRQSKQSVLETCLSEVRHNSMLRDSLFGSVFPPDPSILQNYAQLRTQLGEKLLTNYRSLAVAIALAKRIKGVEKEEVSRSIGRDYQLGFWVDESLQVPGSEPEKAFVRGLAAFMKQSDVSAADLYQNAAIQERCKAFLPAQSIPADWVALVKRSVWFGERLKNAMVLLGQRPGAREPKPTTIAWLRHLITINTATPTSTPDMNGKPMPWPLFPLDTAPWPLLMPLAHSIPLSEADYVWEAFQGAYGPDRYHTYGPYRGDDDVIPDSLRPSTWFWDAWPDRIVHGGMCVPISKGTVDLYSALGKPVMWAGQPGHANLISFQRVGTAWTAEIEQAFAGGPDVTTAQWYFDEDPGTQIRYRDLCYWAVAKYHLGLALGMNISVKSYMDTRIAANIFRSLPSDAKDSLGVKLLRSVLPGNPFNPEIWYRLAEHTSDAAQGMQLCAAAMRSDPSLLSDSPDAASLAKRGEAGANSQYWRTLAPLVIQYSLLSHPAPTGEQEMQRVYTFLKTAPGVSVNDLAAYADRFVVNRPSDAGAKDLDYLQTLVAKGDVYGQWRMGVRYRDGEGVPQNDSKAKEFLALAAGQGDITAAFLLADLTPCIPVEMVTVTTSTAYGKQQTRYLVDGTGMLGALHDNADGALTMWHTTDRPNAQPPANGLPASPAWVRFDFAQPQQIAAILIWNLNQATLTDRGFRKTRIYGSTDGITWLPLTSTPVIDLPRASGLPMAEPTGIVNALAEKNFKSVIIAAEQVDGNYGSSCFGLSAVRFVVRH